MLRLLLITTFAATEAVSPGMPPDSAVCRPSRGGDAAVLLDSARRATGAARGGVLHLTAWRSRLQDFQSDRTYEPFFASFETFESWTDPDGGGERIALTAFAFPRTALPGGRVVLSGARATWIVTDSTTRAAPTLHASLATTRPLNPWAVLADFRADAAVRVVGHCTYRDYPRISLERAGPLGPERLLLDARSLVPVALLRAEPHPLWGQVAVEYVWSNWDRVTAGVQYPSTVFRVVDGRTEISQTVTAVALVPGDSAPRLAIPDAALEMPATLAVFARPTPPDTVRVSATTWLLRSREYTTAITLQHDTVFVLDATLSEARAQLDADWVARLFPGRHPVVLVVTDLAWPHIGGVRYWVARGAIIASHHTARRFLAGVIQRRWAAAPDMLEQRRAHARFVFRPVTDSLVLAGGNLVLHPIDGISSEGALVAWVPDDRFLWAGDYVQDIRTPTAYAGQVRDAVRRIRITPERFAAQHRPLSPWSQLDALFAGEMEPPTGR